jgi:hypothetical protein
MKGSRMQKPRRYFLKQFAGFVSLLLGGTQITGCLGESDTQGPVTSQPSVQSGSAETSSQATQAVSFGSEPVVPSQGPANAGPVWQASPTIDFVEGVPAVVSIRNFVNDSDGGTLVVTLNSGTLLPGITWNPNDATLSYDGRPLGATPQAPVVLTGVTFAADDQNN